jgi:uncharacterized membrane protein
MGQRTSRLGYLDWARGLAVLAMIHSHAVYAWTRPEDHDTWLFGFTRLIGGFPAGLFLFLAGLAAALVSERDREQGRPDAEIRRRALRRGITVMAYALLFRVWMFTTSSFARPADLLRVEILNCIGLSLLMVAVVLGHPTARGRIAGSVILAAAAAMLTPVAWDGPWLATLPPPVLGYLSGRVPDSVYPIFPWATFAALGGATGVILSRMRARGREDQAIAVMTVLGAAAIPAALMAERYGPALYPTSDFWYTSPAYTLIKIGVVLLLVGAAYVLARVPGPSLLRQIGRTSLLIYWVHIEIVYGEWVAPGARGRLSIEDALSGVVLLTLAMLVLSLARTRLAGWRPRWRVVEKENAPASISGGALTLGGMGVRDPP